MNKLIKRGISSLAILAVAGSTMLGAGHTALAKSVSFSDVPSTHWAYYMVKWSAENAITDGYPDGTFRPSQAVTEAEFLVMLLRTYPEIAIDDIQAGEPWYAPYYKLASDVNWPVQDEPSKNMTRGQVARLIAAVLGQPSLSDADAAQLLLNEGIAQGKESSGSGVAGFAPNDKLSRSEAQTFLYRLKKQLPKVTDPQLIKPQIKLQGIALGDSEAWLVQTLGQPDRKDYINGKMEWYIYKRDYKHYAQIAVADQKVVALFSNGEGWQFEAGDTRGLTDLGTRAEQLWGKTDEPENHETVYALRGSELHLYLDSHEGNRVDGALLMDQAYAEAYASSEPSAAWLSTQEKEIFDLTNTFRLQKGLKTLTWNEPAAVAARLHAQDMADRNYFEHKSPEGRSAGDRMAAQGLVAFRAWGENIAAGYTDGIEAHYGWINSEGHRVNMLDTDFTTLGTGAAVSDKPNDYGKYYGQNFYTPR